MLDGADQPLFEPPLGTTPLWHDTRVVALYDSEFDLDVVLQVLAGLWAPEPLPAHRIEQLEEREWTRAWMDHFQPMRFGERLWIIPTGFDAEPTPAVNIHLDPGLAFGTGTHPTTRLCLEWLDAHPPAGQSVCDYGCGSGILAVAAGLLGATELWGVDNDPQALIATRDNAERNGMAGTIEVYSPEGQPRRQADLVLANILAGPLQELAPHLAALVKPGGHVVLSGILADQAKAVLDAYRPYFSMAEPVLNEEWVRLEGVRT